MNRIRTFLASISAPEAAPPWSLTTAALAILVAFIAMIIGTGVVFVWLNTQPYTELAGWTLGALVILLFIWQTRRRDGDALRLNTSKTPILLVMFIALGSAIALDLVSLAVTKQFFPAPELQYLNPNALGVLDWVLAIVFMVILQPIAEELIFRGITLPAIRTKLSAWGSILVTAGITGVFHFLVYPLTAISPLTPIWYGLVIPIIEGIIFGMVRNSTQSTRAAIAAHIAFGLFAIVKLLTLT
jgi:membrane protease YdiL (CAAX protease family)